MDPRLVDPDKPGEQFGVWMKAQMILASLTIEQYAEVEAEAAGLVELMGKDPETRKRVYLALPPDEQRTIRIVFGTYRRGALVMNNFSQSKDEWKSALMGAFALRKANDARKNHMS